MARTGNELHSLLRDKDGDGKLSLKEFRAWLMPDNYDPFNVEALHLIHHADSDMVYDCMLGATGFVRKHPQGYSIAES